MASSLLEPEEDGVDPRRLRGVDLRAPAARGPAAEGAGATGAGGVTLPDSTTEVLGATAATGSGLGTAACFVTTWKKKKRRIGD